MEKRQVLLVRLQPLLAEGLQRILRKLDEIELVILDCVELPEIIHCLQDLHPSMILLAGEKEDDQATHLITYLLNHYEDIPVVWAELEKNSLRWYTSHSLTATSSELIHAIRELDHQAVEIQPTEKKAHPGN